MIWFKGSSSVLLTSSHASPNVGDGLNFFDGTETQYFAAGETGTHSLWGSKCFDYKKREVVQFLLGQILFFVEEYRIDGFRFDGVTSMLYNDHAIEKGFNGDYQDYFGFHSNVEIARENEGLDQHRRDGLSCHGQRITSFSPMSCLLHCRGRVWLSIARCASSERGNWV